VAVNTGWAKVAAEEPDSHGVGRFRHSGKYGQRWTPITASPAHLRRRISDKKWKEAREWSPGSRIPGSSQMPQTDHAPDTRKSAETDRRPDSTS